MKTAKPVRRVLVVSGGRQMYEFIVELMSGGGYDPITYAGTVGEAKRLLMSSEFDILVVNTPMPDEFGTEFALEIAEKRVGVLLLCKNEMYDQMADRVEEYGILTLPKPTTKQSLYTAMRMLSAVTAKYVALEKKNQSLQEKMADIRVVNRAKWLLIEHLGMTERDAHYHIEKQAMDMRLSRREVAEYIIRTYDK